jgi:methylenetetrahydrofolate reductase (NADPH)
LTEALAGVTRAARVAHLTLVGHPRAELEQAVGRFVEAGVEGFMALRGDPPGGPAEPWAPTPGGLRYAVELVALIRQLTDLPVGVAAFPQGHPKALSPQHDAAVLAAKQAAGASFALTQVVFDAGAYFDLVDRAARAGATLPLVPGVMPVTAGSRVAKLEQFSGAPLPRPLAEAIARADSPAQVSRLGADWSVRLVRELLAGGAPGAHFYTLNSPVTEAICLELDLAGGRSR